MPTTDIVVIGGGQAALALGFYLRRSGLSSVILDEQAAPGGAWCHTWRSLRLFSPAQWSSLPGWLMPRERAGTLDGDDDCPSREDVIAYLTDYERRYALPVLRPVHVRAVRRAEDGEAGPLIVEASTPAGARTWHPRAVVSATGTWANPVIPDVPGREQFAGEQLHSARYWSPEPFAGRRVVVVGAGNSGAQIVAELSEVAEVTWATRQPPVFLPEHVDGRYLFEQATARYKALQEGRPPEPPRSLGDIVRVAPVRTALERGTLEAEAMFERFTQRGVAWPDGRETVCDVVIWATGFRPALAHLAPLGVVGAEGRIAVRGTRSVAEPGLWLVGYGEWTGFASATLIGVGRSARATVEEMVQVLAPTGDAAAGAGAPTSNEST